MPDPRNFTVKSCPTTKGVPNDSNLRKDFFSQLGKVGDLEFLNNSALGTDVGEGLRGLAKLSNSVRVGEGALPSILGSAVDTGANFVLDAVGIGPAVVETLRPFHPQVVNRGVAQAGAIWEDVQDGTYKLSDIPDTFSDLQNLERLARGIYTPPESKDTGPEVCEASPWAMDLDPFFPKYKFLFLVQFELSEPYAAMKRGQQPNIFEFVIKHSTRPNIQFDYEEVNMYNFRTQVAKRTVYQPMTMRFYDDNQNRIMQFYTTYLKAISPIANMSFNQKREGTDIYEQSGMAFGQTVQPVAGINTNQYSGSLGVVGDDDHTKTFIKRVNLFHIFSNGRKANKYIFFNPKITNMDLDELDMATAAEGNEVSLQFAYDGLYISPGMSITQGNDLTGQDTAAGAKWPFHSVSTEDTIVPEPGGAPPGEQTEAGSGISGIIDDLTNLGGQAVAIGQDAVDFAAQTGQNAISGITNTVTSGARTAVNSVAGAAAGLFGGGPRKLG